jgi:hypothetical protein
MVLRKQIILVFWSLSLAPTLSPALQAHGQSQESVNQHARVLRDFEHRIAEYLKLRKTVEAGMPKLKCTDSPAMITQHERELASRIREARQQAKQGDIFTGTIVLEFRRLIGITMQGPEAAHIKHLEIAGGMQASSSRRPSLDVWIAAASALKSERRVRRLAAGATSSWRHEIGKCLCANSVSSLGAGTDSCNA